MKEYLKTLGIGSLIIFVGIIYLRMHNLTIGTINFDFSYQHIKFIEYLRTLIFSSRDLTPQLTMNYGLGQSFVALYYHGMYNPFIMASLILGSDVSIKVVMYFIYMLILILSLMGMHLLARLNSFSHYEARIISLLTSFSGVVMYHFGWHPMYIYYFPFMILSLVSIHYMVQKDNPYLYSLALGLVFYTNFFFAPIVSIIQFLYFIGLCIDKGKSKRMYFPKFIKAYTLGVLWGMVILIPVYYFSKVGLRTENLDINSVSIFSDYKTVMANILNHPYTFGIGVVPLFATIYSLLFLDNKRYKLPLVGMIIILSSEYILLKLNLNMYLEYKHFVFFIPILWLVMGEYIFKNQSKKNTIVSVIITILLVIMASSSIITDSVKIMLFINLSLLVIMNSSRKDKLIVQLITAVIVISTVGTTLNTVDTNKYKEVKLKSNQNIETKNLTKELSQEPYRTLENDLNKLGEIDSFNPNIYTSLENGYYIDFLEEYLELEKAGASRIHLDSAFDNMLIRSYLGIKDGKADEDVIPMVYGVTNSNIHPQKQLDEMEKNQRLFAINQAVFVESGKEESKLPNGVENIEVENNEFIFEKNKETKTYKVPEKIKQDGLLKISFESDLTSNDTRTETIKIDKHINHVMTNDYYGKNNNKEITFLIDTNADLDELVINFERSDNTKPVKYSNLQFSFISKDEFENKKFDYVKPDDFKVKYSDYYTFKLDLKEAGMLATTIPYDKGFSITVNEKEVPIEKINGAFLGAKLEPGVNVIKIQYNIPGFKLGSLISTISLLIIVVSTIKNSKRGKKE